MSDKLKPVNCGCGGNAAVLLGESTTYFEVKCCRCGTKTALKRTRNKAIETWNRAMTANADALKLAYDEGYAKAKKDEAVSRRWDEAYRASQRYGYPMDMGG